MLIPNPAKQKTFQDYVKECVIPYIEESVEPSKRLDFVNDTYNKYSLKSHTRDTRGTGVRLHNIHGNLKLPGDWQSFLRNNNNKTQLIEWLSCGVVSEMKDSGGNIIFTVGDEAKSIPDNDNIRLSPCNQEEADTTICLHIADATEAGHATFKIRTNDTDVVVLAIAFASKKNVHIYVSFGTGTTIRTCPQHSYNTWT